MHISAHTYNFIKIKANLLLLAFQKLESSLGFLSEKLQPEFYFNNFLDNVFINVYPHFRLLSLNHSVQYGVEIIRSMSRYILGMEFKQKMIEIIERKIVLIAKYSRLYVIRFVFSCEFGQRLKSKTIKANKLNEIKKNDRRWS